MIFARSERLFLPHDSMNRIIPPSLFFISILSLSLFSPNISFALLFPFPFFSSQAMAMANHHPPPSSPADDAARSALIFLGTGCSSMVPNLMCLLRPADPPCSICFQALSIPPDRNPNYRFFLFYVSLFFFVILPYLVESCPRFDLVTLFELENLCSL